MNWWRLKRKVHVSWLIAFYCCGIFLGVFIAQYINMRFIIWLVFGSIFFVCLTFVYKKVYLIPVIILCGIILGLWRGSILQNDLAKFKSFYGESVVAEGVVKDDIETGTSDQITIRLYTSNINNRKITGNLWVTASAADIKRGDKLMLQGVITKGFGNYAGIIYQAKINTIVHPKPGDFARVVRDWFADAIRLAIPDPEASLGIGYLVGQKRALPADLVSALQMAGLTHVVVASGYNLTILVRLARRLFVKISKYLAAFFSVVMILSFIAITGISPSMSRAGLVAGLSLAAWYYGRKFHPVILLLIAIALTVIINPSYAWGDLSWQLSFAAFAGVVIVAPLMQRYFFGDKKPGIIGQILGETISAQLVTAPIIVAAFGQISNIAIVANLLVLPFVPLAMLLTFIAGLGGLLFPSIAFIFGFPANLLLGYMVRVIEFCANLPWAVSSFQASVLGVIVCYIIITLICIYMWRITKFKLREVNLVE